MAPRILLDRRMTMRDGTALSADVYLPPTGSTFPTLLCRTPYDNQMPYYVNWAAKFTEFGLAAVIQDCRGRYDSEGEWRPYLDEASDGYDTLAWLASQDWCNGHIGTFGYSYVGFTQILPLSLQPQGVRAVLPIGNQEDNYGHIWCDGVLQLEAAVNFFHLGRRTMQSASASLVDMDPVYRSIPLSRALDEIAECPPYLEFLAHPTLDEYWLRVSMKHRYPEVSVPALFVTGWYDNLVHEQFKLFTGWKKRSKTRESREYTKIIVGPWTHYEIGERIAGDADFGPNAELDLPELHRDWYLQRLEGIRTGIDDDPPVRVFVMGRNEWRHEGEWPPSRVEVVPWYLSSAENAGSSQEDGALVDSPPPRRGSDEFVYDPLNPVPTLGGASQFWGGARDRRQIESREDVLVFTSHVLEEELEVIGEVTAVIYARTSGADTDFTATLVDVYPDGTAMIVCEGITRGRFRHGVDREVFMTPNRIEEIHISLWETAIVFPEGHRVRLEVSSSNFPRFNRNLNTSEGISEGQSVVVAHQEIFHGTEFPSRLLLPMMR